MLTQDPIGLAGGVNLYAYAGSNPIAFADPLGLLEDPGKPSSLQSVWNALRSRVDRLYSRFGGEAGTKAGRSIEDGAARMAATLSEKTRVNHFDGFLDTRGGPIGYSQNTTTGDFGAKAALAPSLEASLRVRISWTNDLAASGVHTSTGPTCGQGALVGLTMDMVNGVPNGISLSIGFGLVLPTPNKALKAVGANSVDHTPPACASAGCQ